MTVKINVIKRAVVLVFFAVLVSTTTAADKILYVDADAVGANNGSNWENAYLCLQDALEDAFEDAFEDNFEGDLIEAQIDYEIRVANGIYKPDRRTSEGSDGTPSITASGDWTDTFFIWDMTVKGGYAGYGEPDPNARNIDLYETILSGDLFGNDVEVDNPEDLREESTRAENSFHVVISQGNSVIDGFIITGGNANDPPQSSYSHDDGGGGLRISGSWYDTLQITNCTFTGNSALSSGGGIYKRYGNLILTNCTFTGNQAGSGGGGGIYAQHGDLNMTNCTFTGNQAGSGGGGGIDANNCTLNLTDCTFIENSTYGEGGGIATERNYPNIKNCTFIENSARAGGGLYNETSNPTLTNCVFRGNSVRDQGGGMCNVIKSLGGDSPILRNCLFIGNRSGFRGGGMYNLSCEPVLTSCTFAGNWAGEGNALYCKSEHERNTVTLTNCILWDFGNEIWNNELSIINVSYSNIQGGWFGEGNIDEYPQFADPNGPDRMPGTEDDDLRLTPLSPCVDSGDPQYVSEPNETDLDGNPRIIGGRVDMGAYEFHERIIYVDDDATGANDGSSWLDAFSDLQDAIMMAQTGYEIRVAQGIYTPTQDPLDRDGTFQLKDGVSIIGGYAGLAGMDPDFRHTEFFKTILSGDIDHNDDSVDPNNKEGNSHHVVTCTGQGNAAVLDGVTITGGYSDSTGDRAHGQDVGAGGGLYCFGACSPRLIDCVFTDNYAQWGGAVSLPYNYGTSDKDVPGEDSWKPVFTRCIFTNNNAGSGGAISCGYGWRPEFVNCLFENNNAGSGGAILSQHSTKLMKLNHCVFRRNSAGGSGGAIMISTTITDPEMQFFNCLFENNNAESNGGAISSWNKLTLIFHHCVFRRNSAGISGGAINTSLSLMCKIQVVNCLFVANTVEDTGGAIACSDFINGNGRSIFDLLNCTFYGNTPPTFYKPPTNSVKLPDGSSVYRSSSIITNCIFYNKPSYMAVAFEFGRSKPYIITSIYEKKHEAVQPRAIPPMPDVLFVDPNGADGILGTEDDDFRLTPISPAVDSGANVTVPPLPAMDLDGNPRIVSDSVDIGAYEFQGHIYVDDDASADPGPGDILVSDPLENGAKTHPMDSIQEAIDLAKDGYTVLVQGGIYSEPIDFKGKAITVTSGSDVAVLETPGDYAVSFLSAEGPDSILKKFVIKNSVAGVFIPGSSPTIRNLTAVNNEYGITAYTWAEPDISNCIFWNNSEADLFQCEARYSYIEDGGQGQGNISVNPLFVDAENGDYHLSSEGWRWDGSETWAYDNFTSPCIDAGDPASPLGDEPMSVPRDPNNEYGINLYINMGAYGGTRQASIPPLNWLAPEYETDPPIPDPAQWAHGGEPREVYGGGRKFGVRIQMTAADAMDASGSVEYFFECTTEADFSSGWQSSRDYDVIVSISGLGHRFRVKARDRFGNETAWSEELATKLVTD